MTLIKKDNNQIKIIVPEVVEGERFFMIEPKYIEHWYDRNGCIYLNNKEWILIKD